MAQSNLTEWQMTASTLTPEQILLLDVTLIKLDHIIFFVDFFVFHIDFND